MRKEAAYALTLGDFADVTGIIRDVLLILIFLVSLFLLVAFYRKLSAVLESAKRTAANVDEIVETVSERIVGPATAGSGVAFGLGKAMAYFAGRKSKNRKEED